LGRLHINRVSQLTKIGGSQTTSHVNPSLADLEGDSDCEDEVSGKSIKEYFSYHDLVCNSLLIM